MNYEKLSLKEWCDLCHSIAKEKGFWDKERNIGEALMLIVTELAEGHGSLSHIRTRIISVKSWPIPLSVYLIYAEDWALIFRRRSSRNAKRTNYVRISMEKFVSRGRCLVIRPLTII